MEKIQQALERAKLQRAENTVGKPRNNYTNNVRHKQAEDVKAIVYTKTQSVAGELAMQHQNRIINVNSDTKFSDTYKILSAQVLQRMEEHRWETLAVTSVSKDEGKTTTAINLGISIAKEIEYTVLLVDTNLRDPQLHKFFGIQSKRGLSDFLSDDIDLSDLLIQPANINHFLILPGGTPVKNSTELLGSPKMCSLVEELKGKYHKRIVIFDLPPVLDTADPLSFLPCIDCALVVVEDDVTKASDLEKSIELLTLTNVIGTVLNKVKY